MEEEEEEEEEEKEEDDNNYDDGSPKHFFVHGNLFALLKICFQSAFSETRPDTRLPKSRAGGQGPYLRLPDHLGGSSRVKE